MQLRLHSDDFGLKAEVDKKLLLYLEKGTLQSVSIFANRTSKESLNALLKLQNRANFLIFLHADVIGPKSIHKFAAECILRKVDRQAIKKEITEQLEKLLKMGFKIDGIDSERHTNSLSPVSEVIEEIAREYKIPLVRSYKSIYTYSPRAFFKHLYLKSLGFLSFLANNLRFGLPSSWKIEADQPWVVASWEEKSLDLTQLKDVTLLTHPHMGFDSNTSYEKLLTSNVQR